MNSHPDLNSPSAAGCAVVILAAGDSSRMGQPKQLLPYRGQSLIRHVISVALESRARPVIVVLGAGHEEILAEIGEIPGIHVVVNDRWREGIASSIRTGVTQLRLTGVAMGILAVCDQPLIDAALLDQLIYRQKEGDFRVVASGYGETFGTPALFHSQLFDQLLSLTGDTGAKRVIAGNADQLAWVPFPGGEMDIDTRAEYDAFNEPPS